jgi:hypothetical protein
LNGQPFAPQLETTKVITVKAHRITAIHRPGQGQWAFVCAGVAEMFSMAPGACSVVAGPFAPAGYRRLAEDLKHPGEGAPELAC